MPKRTSFQHEGQMRLHTKAFALSFGIVCGLSLFAATIIATLRHIPTKFEGMTGVLPYYSLSPTGSLLGLVYGFFLGGAVGGVFSWTYNRIYEKFLTEQPVGPSPQISALPVPNRSGEDNLSAAARLWGERAREK